MTHTDKLFTKRTKVAEQLETYLFTHPSPKKNGAQEDISEEERKQYAHTTAEGLVNIIFQEEYNLPQRKSYSQRRSTTLWLLGIWVFLIILDFIGWLGYALKTSDAISSPYFVHGIFLLLTLFIIFSGMQFIPGLLKQLFLDFDHSRRMEYDEQMSNLRLREKDLLQNAQQMQQIQKALSSILGKEKNDKSTL